MKHLLRSLSSLLLLFAMAACGSGGPRFAFSQTAKPAATAAPAPAAAPIDYQALCQKQWPDAQIRSAAVDAPHSYAIFFYVVSSKTGVSRSNYMTTPALAWQDAYLRNHPRPPVPPVTK